MEISFVSHGPGTGGRRQPFELVRILGTVVAEFVGSVAGRRRLRSALRTQRLRISRLQAMVREREQRVLERERTIVAREQTVIERERQIDALTAIVDGTVPPPCGGPEILRRLPEILRGVDGWCSEAKAAWLVSLILRESCRQIAEIGVFGGRSLLPMALAARSLGMASVLAVEPWDNEVAIRAPTGAQNDAWWARVDMPAVKSRFLRQLVNLGLADVVRLVEGCSAEALRLLGTAKEVGHGRFDLVHIDGSHAPGQALQDVLSWSRLVRPGGIVVLDDIAWDSVGAAVAWLRGHFLTVEEVREADGASYGAYRRPLRRILPAPTASQSNFRSDGPI